MKLTHLRNRLIQGRRLLVIAAVLGSALLGLPRPVRATPPIAGPTIEFDTTGQHVGTHSGNVRSTALGDLDGDGDLDVVSGGTDYKVYVWQNDGSPFTGTWTAQEAGTHGDFLFSVALGDLDGDGDLDVASCGADDKVNVWQNDGTPFSGAWTKQEVGAHTEWAMSVALGDLDGDGDLDLASGGLDKKINVWRNDGTPFSGAWTKTEVGTLAGDPNSANSLAIADLDDDGNPDIVSGAYGGSLDVWRNSGSPFSGAWTTSQSVGSHASIVRSVALGDLDGDGDLDVGSAGDDAKVNVWENDGSPFAGTWTKQEAGSHTAQAYSVSVGDLDGDGDLDLASGGFDYQVNAWQNDGSPFSGTWGTPRKAGSHTNWVFTVAAGDLDGDGDLDLASGGFDYQIQVWQNAQVHRNMPFHGTPGHVGTLGDNVNSVAMGDLDGDGDPDIVSGGNDDQVNVWQNDGTPYDSAWAVQEVGSHASGVLAVTLGDLDRDGDLDVVSGGYDDKVNVWENDGTPFSGAWTKNEVGAHSDYIRSVQVGDFDGDGTPDIVSSGMDDKINVWRNDGTPFSGSWTKNEVGSQWNDAISVAVADLNGDGRLDIVSGGGPATPGNVNAWQNDGTPFSGTWSSQTVGSHGSGDYVESVAVGDLNEDGAPDIVSGAEDAKVIVWENDGSPFSGTWTWQQVGSQGSVIESVELGDMDLDGDLDIASGAGSSMVNTWRNDGTPFSGAWSKQNVGSHGQWITSVALGDLDMDGDLDIASGDRDYSTYPSHRIMTWKNIGGSARLAVSDTAPGTILVQSEDDLVKVVLTHNGVAGDRDLEWSTCDLHLLRGDCTTPLTTGEANALIENLRIRLDDGDGIFETGDGTVADVASLSLDANGTQAISFSDGDADVQVGGGGSKTYWISALTTDDASIQSPNQFCVTFDPDADALVQGKADGASEPDFSVSIQDTAQTDAGPVTAVAPDLTAGKTNDAGGAIILGSSWTWTVTVTNNGNGDAIFNDGQTILSDDLPDGSMSYGDPGVANTNSVTGSTNISCTISGSPAGLVCAAQGGNVTIGATDGSFAVHFEATPAAIGTYDNPRSGGLCEVDPGAALPESDEANNAASDTVTVTAPD
jgi:hypothetical protein